MGLKWIAPRDAAEGGISFDASGAPVTLPVKVAERWHYPIVRVTSSNLSAKGVVEGGYGSVFGTATSESHFQLVEVSATIPNLGKDTEGNEAVFGRNIAAGVTTSDNSGSLSMAVAKATIKSKSNSMKILTSGIADAATATLRQAAGGQLTTESARTFGQGMADCMNWIVTHAPQIDDDSRPDATFAVTPSDVDELRSICFAIGQIAQGRSLDQALDQLHRYHASGKTRRSYATVEEAFVAAIYHAFRLTGAPDDGQRHIADELLKGRGGGPAANGAQRRFEKAVLPYITTTGAVASLRHLAPEARIRTSSWPPAASELTPPKQEIGNHELTLSGTLDIGLSTVADIHSTSDVRLFGYNAWSTYARAAAPNTIILSENYGAGIRASIRYVGTDLSVASQVAAKVTLGEAAASFAIDVVGVDVEQLPSIGAFVGGATSAFDATTMGLIGSIWSEANAVITAHDRGAAATDDEKRKATGWHPCLTSVVIDLGAPELQARAARASAALYALDQIADGKRRADACAAKPDWTAEVNAVYDTLHAGEDAPPGGVRDEAKNILRIGR